MEDTYPPKLPSPMAGYTRLYDSKNSTLGGPANISLYGSPEAPRLYADTPDSFSGVGLGPHRNDLIRFAREILDFLDEPTGVELPPWMPKNGSIGARTWFLSRYHTTEPSIPLWHRYHYGANGSVVRYSSKESAQRAADKLNKQEKADSADDSTRALDAIAAILESDWPGDWAAAMRQRDAVIKVLRGTGRTM